jgi:hypothetical protein
VSIVFYDLPRFSSSHNPKVAGSNPAPATNQINGLERIAKSDSLPFTPSKKIDVSGIRRKGLRTIVTTFRLASLFDAGGLNPMV